VKYFFVSFIFVFTAALVSSCSMCSRKKKTTHDSDFTTIKESYKMLPEEQQIVIGMVYDWNRLHDSINIDSIEAFYNPSVLFYKKIYSGRSIVSVKKYKISRSDSYRQLIVGRIGIYPSDTGDYKCEFLKLVTINGRPNVYHTYLVFKKLDSVTFKIIVESDKEADMRPDLVDLFEKFEESEDMSAGDFNGDGQKEDLVIIKPEQDTSGRYLSSQTKVSFTNFELPEIVLENCVGVNVLNENDVDGDGSDDFSIVLKRPDGTTGEVILYSFKRGKWDLLARFTALPQEVFAARQDLIQFAGNGNINIRKAAKTTDSRDTVHVETISTWGQ
jgi:hypothetical protein